MRLPCDLGSKNVDFVAQPGIIFAVEGSSRQGDKLVVTIRAGEKRWIETDCSQLYESSRMQFGPSEASFADMSESLTLLWGNGPSIFRRSRSELELPCKTDEHRKAANALFEKGFQSMEVKKYPEALRIFFDGLMEDPDNPLALFYLAEIS